jgi:hypothetical protein
MARPTFKSLEAELLKKDRRIAALTVILEGIEKGENLASELVELTYALKESDSDVNRLEDELADAKARLADVTDERDRLYEAFSDLSGKKPIGGITQICAGAYNVQGEWLLSALSKLLEKGRDLEVLSLLEKLDDPVKQRAAVDAIDLHEILY